MSDKQFPASLKPIVSRGYGQTRGSNIWRSDVQGGIPRQGRDTYYEAVPISVVLVVPALGRQAFWSFIASISGGADSFQMTHDTGNGLEPHNVLITSNISETTQDGINWVISFTATAERTSIQESTEFSESLWSLYGEFGDDLIPFVDYYAIYCTTPNFIIDYYGTPTIQTDGVTAYFDGELYYNNNDAVTFSDLVTFSRLSAGSYIEDGVLKTAAANEPRFEDTGLLIEPQSTNLIKKSNPALGADGTDYRRNALAMQVPVVGVDLYSFTKVDGASNGWCEIVTSVGSYPAGTYTASAKIQIPNYLFYARCQALIGGVDTSVLMQPSVSSGYVRMTFTTQQDATRLGLRFGFGTIPDGSSIVIEFCQIESGASATSYIKTTGTAATRSADSASVLMQSHTNGTIFCEFLSDAAAVERIVYTAGAITLKRLATRAISVTAGAVTVTSAVIAAGSVKSAISYDGTTLKLAVNGVVYSAASVLPSAGTSLVLGASTFANVWQRSEAYDNARLIEVTQ